MEKIIRDALVTLNMMKGFVTLLNQCEWNRCDALWLYDVYRVVRYQFQCYLNNLYIGVVSVAQLVADGGRSSSKWCCKVMNPNGTFKASIGILENLLQFPVVCKIIFPLLIYLWEWRCYHRSLGFLHNALDCWPFNRIPTHTFHCWGNDNPRTNSSKFPFAKFPFDPGLLMLTPICARVYEQWYGISSNVECAISKT